MSASVEQVADVIREHRLVYGQPPGCSCGWRGEDRALHVAEQIAALGHLPPTVISELESLCADVERDGHMMPPTTMALAVDVRAALQGLG